MDELAFVVKRAKAGDPEAFDSLVRRFQDMAVGFCLGRVGSLTVAQDAAQDAFIEAYSSLTKLREPRAFVGWFRRILVKQCDQRTRVATNSVPLADVYEEEASDPYHLTERRELQDRVLMLLAALPGQDREVLTLYYLAGHSQVELSAFLGLTVATVNNRLHTARGRLKEKMIPMFDDVLSASRPSRDDNFANSVALCNACISGDEATVRHLIAGDPGLVHCTGEVPEAHMRQMAVHEGWTPLHLAAHYGHLGIAKLLVEASADLEAVSQNPIGNTPISAAAFGNRLEVVEYLLASGAIVDAPNAWGSTALHRAVEHGGIDLALILIRGGADPNLRCADGRDAYAIAQDEGHSEVVEAIRTARA